MEEFTPYPPYHPEDEYAPIEPENTQEAPAPQPAQPAQPMQQPAQPMQQPAQPQSMGYAQQPIQQPAPPVYGSYQPPYPQQPYGYPQAQPQPPVQQQYPQPVQPVQPAQQQYPQPVPPVQPAQQMYPQPQPQYPQQPVQQPYPQQYPQPVYPANAANPYREPSAAPVYTQPKPQKTPTPTGTKVFLIVLTALLAAMLIGFGIYIASSAGSRDSRKDIDTDIENPWDGDDFENGFNFGDYINNNMNAGYQEIEDEITLVEDNGETQQRSTDNEESIGTPDEKAAALKLEAQPSDKDNAKYTATNAYNSVCDSVVTVECFADEITDNDRDIVSSGSGTIISADGYIITNAHVINNSKELTVRVILNNGKKYRAKIVGYDTWTDLAVLKIDVKDLKPVTFGDSKLINVGDDVIAIGSPGGEKFQNSLTKGIVSAVDRELGINRYVRYIQSDAAISPGNSGGPLCNIYGQVIGITTAKTIADYYENMSFSIPSETVKEIVDDLMHYGYVKGRCRIGLVGTEVSEEEIYYYDAQPGILISEIDESGSLADSDLQSGDILTELDGVEITSFQDVYDILADHKPGDKITIKAMRPEE